MSLNQLVSPYRFRFWLRRRSRLEKFFLFLCLAELIAQIPSRLLGTRIPFSGLLDLIFILLAVWLGLVYVKRSVHHMLWRLRNRLIITYFLIGVVPLLLILVMLVISMYFLLGQAAAYLATTELRRHNDMVRESAYSLGWHVASRPKNASGDETAPAFLSDIQKRLPDFQAVVRTSTGTFTVPADAGLQQIPGWSTPGFQGLINSGSDYALAAHIRAGAPDRRVEVFAYLPAEDHWLSTLLPDVAVIRLLEIRKPVSNEPAAKQTLSAFHSKHFVASPAGPSGVRPLPAARGWWDYAVQWGTPLEAWVWNGESHARINAVIGVLSRPSLVIRELFRSLGDLAGTIKWVLLFIGGVFLIVEFASLVFGVSLTRSITGVVAQLYEATRKVKVGDFSYRIPIRSTDQLSELADSFNSMTEDIQRLIVESKEKERLESELEIAREVQTQLFPKRLPRLKTLELYGICNPARIVSGDYYDCFPVDANRTALALGDVSGKGISAALLMAGIQSSLRAQLSSRNRSLMDGSLRELLSTAKLVSLLNQQLYETTTPEKFASFYYGIYDDQQGDLHYTNAGHLPPILIRDGKASRLTVSGMVIGAFPDSSYEDNSVQLEPGDLLAAFTDGITEPENEYGEEFGERRLTDLLLLHAGNPLDEVVTMITTAVNEWQNSPEPVDDMTILLARRI